MKSAIVKIAESKGIKISNGSIINTKNKFKTHDLEVVRTVSQLGALFVQTYILLHLLGVL